MTEEFIGRKRQIELDRYVRLYRERTGIMGATRRGFVADLLMDTTPRGSLLDVGAQCGEGARIALSAGFYPVIGLEPTPRFVDENPGLLIRGHAAELPFADGSWDYVTCWDVIEHLIPEDVETALREFDRVSRREILMTAATGPSFVRESGEDLHPSARPEAKWDELFRQIYPDYQVFRPASPCSPCWVIKKA